MSLRGLEEPQLHPGPLSVLGQMFDTESARGAHHDVEKRSDCLRHHSHWGPGYTEFYGKDDYTLGLSEEAADAKVSSMLTVNSY